MARPHPCAHTRVLRRPSTRSRAGSSCGRTGTQRGHPAARSSRRRGVPRALRRLSAEPVQMLTIVSPPGFERIFQAVATIGEDELLADPERLAALAAQHGAEILRLMPRSTTHTHRWIRGQREFEGVPGPWKGPVMTKTCPGSWTLANSVCPSAEKVGPVNSLLPSSSLRAIGKLLPAAVIPTRC